MEAPRTSQSQSLLLPVPARSAPRLPGLLSAEQGGLPRPQGLPRSPHVDRHADQTSASLLPIASMLHLPFAEDPARGGIAAAIGGSGSTEADQEPGDADRENLQVVAASIDTLNPELLRAAANTLSWLGSMEARILERQSEYALYMRQLQMEDAAVAHQDRESQGAPDRLVGLREQARCSLEDLRHLLRLFCDTLARLPTRLSSGAPDLGATHLDVDAAKAVVDGLQALPVPASGDCPICLLPLACDGDAVALGCGGGSHCFHRACIADWCQLSARCPLCRDSIAAPESADSRACPCGAHPGPRAEEACPRSERADRRDPSCLVATPVSVGDTPLGIQDLADSGPIAPRRLSSAPQQGPGPAAACHVRANPTSPLAATTCGGVPVQQDGPPRPMTQGERRRRRPLQGSAVSHDQSPTAPGWAPSQRLQTRGRSCISTRNSAHSRPAQMWAPHDNTVATSPGIQRSFSDGAPQGCGKQSLLVGGQVVRPESTGGRHFSLPQQDAWRILPPGCDSHQDSMPSFLVEGRRPTVAASGNVAMTVPLSSKHTSWPQQHARVSIAKRVASQEKHPGARSRRLSTVKADASTDIRGFGGGGALGGPSRRAAPLGCVKGACVVRRPPLSLAWAVRT